MILAWAVLDCLCGSYFWASGSEMSFVCQCWLLVLLKITPFFLSPLFWTRGGKSCCSLLEGHWFHLGFAWWWCIQRPTAIVATSYGGIYWTKLLGYSHGVLYGSALLPYVTGWVINDVQLRFDDVLFSLLSLSFCRSFCPSMDQVVDLRWIPICMQEAVELMLWSWVVDVVFNREIEIRPKPQSKNT